MWRPNTACCTKPRHDDDQSVVEWLWKYIDKLLLRSLIQMANIMQFSNAMSQSRGTSRATSSNNNNTKVNSLCWTREWTRKKSCWLLDCCCCCCCCCGVLHKWVWQRWINSNHSARKRKEWHSEWWRIRGKEKEGEESQIRRARVGGSSWRGGHIWETLEGKLEGNTRKRECVYWKRTRACWKRVRANEVSVLNVFNFRRQRYWTKDQFEFC